MKLAFSKAVLVASGVALFAGSLLNAEDKFSPVIVIHGGTSGLELTKDEFKVREEPMKKALLAGQAVLEKGGSAMDAVTAAIMVLEDDPNFNAGKGAVFTADGFNELDTSIMDGSTKKSRRSCDGKTYQESDPWCKSRNRQDLAHSCCWRGS